MSWDAPQWPEVMAAQERARLLSQELNVARRELGQLVDRRLRGGASLDTSITFVVEPPRLRFDLRWRA